MNTLNYFWSSAGSRSPAGPGGPKTGGIFGLINIPPFFCFPVLLASRVEPQSRITRPAGMQIPHRSCTDFRFSTL